MVEVNQWDLLPIQRAPDRSAGSGVEDGTLSVEVINSCNRYLHLCLYFISDFRFAHLNDDYFSACNVKSSATWRVPVIKKTPCRKSSSRVSNSTNFGLFRRSTQPSSRSSHFPPDQFLILLAAHEKFLV
jgi:hypothetical protein